MVWALLRMMPRLEAEESIQMAQRFSIAAGTMDEKTSKDIQAAWYRAIPESPAQKRGQRLTAGTAASMGIGVIPAPVKAGA